VGQSDAAYQAGAGRRDGLEELVDGRSRGQADAIARRPFFPGRVSPR
jgi:hypothetical protein